MKLMKLMKLEGAQGVPIFHGTPAFRAAMNRLPWTGPSYLARWSKGLAEFYGNGSDAVTDYGDHVAVVIHPDGCPCCEA